MLGEQFSEILRYRGLLGMLAWRDIRVRYKQSLLGVAWAFLMPLISALILYAIFRFILIVEAIFAAGLSLILSMANLFFRDVKYVMTFVLQMWFFATNVVYPITFDEHPNLRWIASVNPMIPILDAYRACLMGDPIPNKIGLTISTVIAALVFYFGWKVFHRAEFKFAEYV